ncbi:hypothetical protein J5X84_27155 [Streptosporangiaceae bacterium NEAU-GS5]|nr:hypothetical protein [Streptosporangiaceae bacterium NEAU-GS5]
MTEILDGEGSIDDIQVEPFPVFAGRPARISVVTVGVPRLIGAVVDATGRAEPLELSQSGDGRLELLWTARHTFGTPGPHRIVVEGGGDKSALAVQVETPGAQPGAHLEFAVATEITQTVTGVLTMDDGEPLRGRPVAIQFRPADSLAWMEVAVVWTDKQGRFTHVDHVAAPGSWRAEFEGDHLG